jgi:hypothetical protein
MPRKATRISVSPFQSLAKRISPKLGLDMTSKVTVKANAGNFVFDGNEGWQRRPQKGQLT